MKAALNLWPPKLLTLDVTLPPSTRISKSPEPAPLPSTDDKQFYLYYYADQSEPQPLSVQMKSNSHVKIKKTNDRGMINHRKEFHFFYKIEQKLANVTVFFLDFK